MPATLFVNLPVKDLDRSKAFFTDLGFEFFGMADDMASVIISERTQVMLLTEQTFARFVTKGVADPAAGTEVILVLGLGDRGEVDELVDKAIAAGAVPAGDPIDAGGRYQRAFTDLDGHEWAALCLVQTTES
jgi:predicted lactoylglutathione lyase